MKIKSIISFIIKSLIVIFAIIGFLLLAAWIAVTMHWTNTKGIVDNQTDSFWEDSKAIAAALTFQGNNSNTDDFFNKQNYCLLSVIKSQYPADFTRIMNLALDGNGDLAQKNLDSLVLVLNINTNPDFSVPINTCQNNNDNISEQDFKVLANLVDEKSPFTWANANEWTVFKYGVIKDKDILDRVEKETGINQRILVGELMAEQMRLFYSYRPEFKQTIEPLKVLGSMTQFSWGVFGVKEDTAMHIESYLKDPSSPYYPGPEYQNMLDFKTQNIQQERFNRITDNNNHYYAYLYAALYDKEIIAQWKKAGYDISNRPEILATLYNIGFSHSTPNANPQVGGAELNVNNQTYSFGRLAGEFYYSGELLDEFPQYIPANKTANDSGLINNFHNNQNNTTNTITDNSAAGLSSAVSNQQNQQGAPNWSQLINLLFPIIKK